MEIIEISTIDKYSSQLVTLLQDCVNSGASVGFIAPLSESDAQDYWSDVDKELQSCSKKLFIALHNNQILGSVQLALSKKANGSHRGEIQKLMVYTSARGQGLSKTLMSQVETIAQAIPLSLLILDTREGDVASQLYRKLNYVEAGRIPKYAKSSNGIFHTTVFFYKEL